MKKMFCKTFSVVKTQKLWYSSLRGGISGFKEILGVLVPLCALIAYIVKISFSYSKLKEEQKKADESIDFLKTCNDVNTKQISLAQTKLSTLEIFIQGNTKKLDECEKKNSQKFDELFNSRNKTNEVLAELNTTIRMLVSNINTQFENLDNKIEELKRNR